MTKAMQRLTGGDFMDKLKESFFETLEMDMSNNGKSFDNVPVLDLTGENECNDFIYFIITHDKSFVKIGRTEDPKNRMWTMQTSNPHKLDMALLIKYNKNENIKVEKVLHKLFQNYKHRQEWFRYENQVKEAVEHPTHFERFLINLLNELEERDLNELFK